MPWSFRKEALASGNAMLLEGTACRVGFTSCGLPPHRVEIFQVRQSTMDDERPGLISVQSVKFRN